MGLVKSGMIVIVDKTKKEPKVVFLDAGYAAPKGNGADLKRIAEEWEKTCQEFEHQTEIDAIVNSLLHRIGAVWDWWGGGWIFSTVYSFRTEFDWKSDYLYVFTMNKEKQPRYIDFDAYQIPEQFKDGSRRWEEICIDENRVEMPKECKWKSEPIWKNPNLKYEPKDE